VTNAALSNSQPASLAAAVSTLADALASATSPQEIYDAALHGIRTALGVERASVLLFDPDGVMRFKAWRGLSDEYRRSVEGHTPWTLGQPTPEPIVVADVKADPSLEKYHPVFAREDIRALGFIPLASRGKTIGKFMLYWREPHTPARSTLDAASVIGSLVGLAVERARQNAELAEQQQRVEAALGLEAATRERWTRLAEGARRLQISHDRVAIVQEVLALAEQSVTADAYAVWRKDGAVWRMVAHKGLPGSFTKAEVPAQDEHYLRDPIVAVDALHTPLLEGRRQDYLAAGIRSLVSVPLQIRGRPSGTLAFYFRETHTPSDLELRIAQAVGELGAAAISSAELYAEQQSLRTLAVRGAERAAFLADASVRLSSLDYEKNLEVIARLMVPQFADWCVVDLIESGELRRLAVAHADPAKEEFAHELHRRYPPRRDEPGGFWHVINSGEPLLFSHIEDDMLQRAARDEDHLLILRDLGLRSAMLVPLRRSQEVLGVLTLVVAGGERRFDAEDLEFAQEVARRASYAVENARLYRQAQEANRAKDEFLAALSHELRTPLNAILGWASILRARPEGQIDRGLDVIYRNAKVQTQLVEDLLDASRIVSGRMSIDLKDVPLRPIIEAAVETVVPQAVEKDIEFRTKLPDSALLIRGDAARLQQVFWNILSNAVKFTPRGGRIEVATSGSPAEVAVTVVDTGAGIKAEALPFIFDRFRQADASSTRRYRGLGLGLTLSRQLTEMHGGKISASSPGPGLGAAFTVALPLVELHPPRPVKSTSTAADALAGLRIVAVDDDPDSLDVLTSILRLHQATVFGASSAVEALELAHRERPDVIISDIAMPEHDGYWLMQQLQRIAEEGGRSVPCIALTAFANETARRRAIATGFAAHLSKPLNPDELVNIIRPLIVH
jgi:signal transduction histidine kinase